MTFVWKKNLYKNLFSYFTYQGAMKSNEIKVEKRFFFIFFDLVGGYHSNSLVVYYYCYYDSIEDLLPESIIHTHTQRERIFSHLFHNGIPNSFFFFISYNIQIFLSKVKKEISLLIFQWWWFSSGGEVIRWCWDFSLLLLYTTRGFLWSSSLWRPFDDELWTFFFFF